MISLRRGLILWPETVPAGEQSVIPEKDDFDWLLDRDPGE